MRNGVSLNPELLWSIDCSRQITMRQSHNAERPTSPEVSVVIPCLNEADTLATCIRKAQGAFAECEINGEIIVADNGSTDGSAEIAASSGSRVIHVAARGYGNALKAGIEAARAELVIMGDADNSYDFAEIPRFVEKLHSGFDLVQGCRLASGGGHILPGAMPALHRWIGNPLLSLLVRKMFGASIHDVYCGFRGFRRQHWMQLNQRCTGMEFATEMIVKSTLYGGRITELPITLHPDGRKSHPPHLRSFRDGWRTLRFFLLYSPRWLFLFPGLVLVLLGLVGYAVALPGLTVTGITFDAHTLLFASLAMLIGYQSILFAIFAKTFAIGEGLVPPHRWLDRFYALVSLERGLILGAVALAAGLGMLVAAIEQWRQVRFGHLDYPRTMRWVVPGMTLTALGFQTILASFFASVLEMRRR